MKRFYIVSLLAVAAVAALAFSAFSGGSVQATERVFHRVEVELLPGKAMPHATGMAELELRIDDEGDIDFRAKATAEGLTKGAHFVMYVDDVFVDADKAEGGKVDFDGEPEVMFTTLSGLVVTVTAKDGTVALYAKVP